jgi:nitrite reductase/ring-hydroxylating ferredoxin subunit
MLTKAGVTRSEVEASGHKVIRRAGKQVLLIARGGRIFAIANRCPHEGYPLSEGSVQTLKDGCVLTCNWHNWKFDLRTGAALIGRDPVRSYPVTIEGNDILLDLSDPSAEAQREAALKGLDTALEDRDLARMARETARLMRAGYDAKDALVHAITITNEFLEDGSRHSHGAAADWLALAARAKTPEQSLIAVLEPIYHLSWDTMGRKRFAYTGGLSEWNEDRFVAAMDAEDEAASLSCIRGALKARIPYADLRPAFGRAALAHYADFGHSAIYAVKIGQLLETLDGEAAEPLLLALTRSIVRARREEKLPEFRFYEQALSGWGDGGVALVTASELTGKNVNAVLTRLLQSAGRDPHELYEALLGAAGWNLLHFDTRFETATGNVIADNVGWLDFTHALTFANAARQLCGDVPALWPQALLQMALFVGRNSKCVGDVDEARWRVSDPRAFLNDEMDKLYDHGLAEPIIYCHRLKMLFALEGEWLAAPDASWRKVIFAGVNRFLNTPIKRHHGLRTAHQALDFIAKEG